MIHTPSELDTAKALNETAKQFGYSVRLRLAGATTLKHWALCNAKNEPLKKIKLTKKRIQIRSIENDNLNYSMPLSQPEDLAKFLESYYFAKKL